MSNKGSANRSSIQPNPGRGVLCKGCEYRESPPRDNFPCKKKQDAKLERKTPLGGDIITADKFGIDFWETCAQFQSISSW